MAASSETPRPASSTGRASGRAHDELRRIELLTDVNKYAEGSCLAKFGDTHVLCMASVDDRVPSWLKGSGQGWVTAEYGMLPRATDQRTDREAARGKQTGRTQEIQRLVGRSLRAVTDLRAIADLQIKIDCDVLQADGGTRTAAITGSYVALALAVRHLAEIRRVKEPVLIDHVAAVSCGILGGRALLDLDYAEDSMADADANFVLTGSGKVVEVQATAEKTAFERADLDRLLDLAAKGVEALVKLQKDALAG